MLAVVLAAVLGASHAMLPGHGKTVMAAYLAGRRGTRRDALLVGATVTATHTTGVLVLGLGLSVATAVAADGVLSALGVISGLLVAGIGVGAAGVGGAAVRLRRDRRIRCGSWLRLVTASGMDTGTGTDTDTGMGTDMGTGTGRTLASGVGRWSASASPAGLVPSPTALLVLLGAIGLGRTWFGVGLVLSYGLGMAATLTAAGLLLVVLRDRLDRVRFSDRLRRRTAYLVAATPVLTALLVLVVGLGLAARSLAGLA